MSMNCGCLFLSTVSPLVEACKQVMHSTLSSRYKQVGSAFLTDSTDEEQDIDVL